jgi:hypothetical protein
MSQQEFASHHASHESVDRALAELRSRIKKLDLPALEADLGFSLAQAMSFYERELAHRFPLPFANAREFLLQLAEQLPLSEVGAFLLCAQGCDWRTTDFFFDEEYKAHLKRQQERGLLPLFDHLLFFLSPGWLATQERFRIFQSQTQPQVVDGASLASVPCGRMRDLLTLDYTRLRQPVRLVGIDKDEGALAGARELAQKILGKDSRVRAEWRAGDALRPGMTEPPVVEEFDLVTSNGLNIYLTDEQCALFYANVFAALKPGGIFITSHLVLPTYYRWDRVNRHHVQFQTVVWKTLINPLWESFLKPPEAVWDQLKRAGFVEVLIVPDSQGIFPTFVGHKPA